MSEDNSTSTATFDFEVTNVTSSLHKGKPLLSNTFILHGLSWNIVVWRKNTKCLGVYLQCECRQEKTDYSCHAQAKLSLLSMIDGVDDFSRSIEHTFNLSEFDWGFCNFILWSKVTDPLQGYIKNDTITIRAHVIADNPIIPISAKVTEPASKTESGSEDAASGTKSESDDAASETESKSDDADLKTESGSDDAASGTKSESDDAASETESKMDDADSQTESESDDVDWETESESDDTASETESESDDTASETESESDDAASETESESDDAASEIAPKSDNTASKAKSQNDDEAKKKEVSDDIAPAVDHPIRVKITELISEIESMLSMSSEAHVNASIGQATEAESPSPTINESDKDEQKSSEAEVSQVELESTTEKSYSEMCLLS